MPVILDKETENNWLNEGDPDKLMELLKPYPAMEMEAYPVSTEVNSPVNNSGELIRPAGKKL